MASSEFTQVVKSLKRLSDEQDDETSGSNLSKLFDSCLRMHALIDDCSLSSNDKEFQEAINVCIKSLEKCTIMVNELDLFSSNETFEELQTPSIRYLMLPSMLGGLTIAIQSKDLSERMKYVEMAEVYFRDFLLRCKNYEVSSESLKSFNEMLDNESNETVVDPSFIREKKIQQFKHKKELEERLKVLKPALDRLDSEEYVREYYFLLLEKWILIAVEEVGNLKNEKAILESMPNRDGAARNNLLEKKPENKPLRPIIITKNEIQKKVFGLGYPSMPVLTIDDFYRQRFEKQVEEHKANKGGKSLQEAAFRNEGLDQESEEIQKERDTENDDPDALLKARNWEEWKDDNPRGSGNRWNKG